MRYIGQGLSRSPLYWTEACPFREECSIECKDGKEFPVSCPLDKRKYGLRGIIFNLFNYSLIFIVIYLTSRGLIEVVKDLW